MAPLSFCITPTLEPGWKRYYMDKPIVDLRLEDTETQVEFSIVSLVDESHDERRRLIQKGLSDIDSRILNVQKNIDEYNKEIEKLTNHADGWDNLVAVCSGVLCGLIDSFFVGEFNFAELKADANKHVNKFIESYARMNGYKGDGRLKGAISFLEEKFPVDQDNSWKSTGISSTILHHLEDIAHHPTPIGLLAAMVVTFFRIGIFVDKKGKWNFQLLDTDPKKLLKVWLPILISGVMLWLIYLAKAKNPQKWEKLPKPIRALVKALAAAPAVIKVLEVAHNWFGHLVSDMGGSKNTAGGGMGIPGLFLSLLKEIASVPPLNATSLPKIVSDIYSKDKFDMRAELAVVEHLGKQAIPVIINEVIVRTFYFVRRLILEKQHHENWNDVNWHNVIPFNNRTISRMLTIASGTFMAVDMADAAIRAGIKSGAGVDPATFAVNFFLRVNFVGVGRFAVAVWTDAKMGVQKNKKERERSILYQQQVELYAAKMFYKDAEMWIAAEDASRAVEETMRSADKSIMYFADSWNEISQNLESLDGKVNDIESNNPNLMSDIINILN